MPNCPTCHDRRIVIRRDGYDSDDHHFVETGREVLPCPACGSLLRSAHALYDHYDLEDDISFAAWMTTALRGQDSALTALYEDGMRRVEALLLDILRNGKKYTAEDSLARLFGTVEEAYAKGLRTCHLIAQASWWVAAEQQEQRIAIHNRLADLHRLQGVDTYEH